MRILSLICSFLLIEYSTSSVNLLLPMHETEKLLGMQRELSYVRDGVLNKGAVGFKIPLSSDLESLHFLWWNGDFTSVVNYKIIVMIKNTDIMFQPSLNISHSGQVPKKPTYWRMSLPCNNLASGPAEIDIQFDLGSNLQFKLSRQKMCFGMVDNLDKKSDFKSGSSISSHVVFIYSLLIAFILALVLAVFVSLMQKKYEGQLAKKDMQAKPVTAAKMFQGDDPSPLLPPIEPTNFPTNNAGFSIYDGGITSDAESRVTDWIQQQYMKQRNNEIFNKTDESGFDTKTPEEIAKDIEVIRSRLKLGSLIQEGTFGKVYQGRFKNEDIEDIITDEEDVMIKTVMSWSSSTQSQLLVIDGVKLAGLNHKHILSPWAMTWDGTSPMFIYPYASQGNLKQYLTKFAQAGLSTHQIVKHGVELLSAMGHLHKRKLIHRDIATRNCFLTDNQTLKLCDSALSRDLFPSDYHCLGDNNNRPIKWMPLESINQNRYSRASDVWSFGVFMWELMTKAQQPFSEVDPFEIEDYLTGGYRLHQPLNCPDQLYSVLVSCWGSQPQERASVLQLHQTLQELQKQLQQFV